MINMNWWSYVYGTLTVCPMGRTQAEKRYILDTVLEHLPVVTGSERDMNVYIIQKEGDNNSCSWDEFGEVTNNLRDSYGNRNHKRGWLRVQHEYILVVDGSLRDREFAQTYTEFQKWICRLAKRISVKDVLIEIKDYEKNTIIRNNNDTYGNMYEDPSWCKTEIHNNWKLNEKLKQYHPEKEFYEPNWCEYLMWERMDNCDYPRLLGYKYFNDEENDKKVETWIRKGE